MGEKSPNIGDEYPIDGIDGALDKEEGIPTRSGLFPIIFLEPEYHFMASKPPNLILFNNQL